MPSPDNPNMPLAPSGAQSTPVARQLLGKFRGRVLDNIDPLQLGRLLVEVPQVPGMLLNWAMPCVPYAGPEVGFYFIPPLTANVWVEFENGDPTLPVWTGCFWSEGQMPLEPVLPEIKVLRTRFNTFQLNDIPEEGGMTLRSIPPVVNDVCTLKFDAEGIQMTIPEAALSMTPETIEVTVPESTLTLTAEAIAAAVPPASVEITGEAINVEIPPNDVTLAEEGITVESPLVDVTADVNITGAVEVEGDVEIAGAVEIEGNVEIAGAVEIEGNVEILGAVEIQGEVNILGAAQIEGDFNVLGAQQIEGDLAVAGIIEGVIVPPF